MPAPLALAIEATAPALPAAGDLEASCTYPLSFVPPLAADPQFGTMSPRPTLTRFCAFPARAHKPGPKANRVGDQPAEACRLRRP
jgi:hypothetical protein